MNRKKTLLLILLLVVVGGAWYAYREYSRTNKDLLHTKPDFILDATDLIKEYESSDTSAARKYNGKVVEVSGVIKGVEKDERGYYTVVMGDTMKMSAVRCALDTNHHQDAGSLAHGAMTVIRGACTGFNKDEMGLGSDVILNRCAIIVKKD